MFLSQNVVPKLILVIAKGLNIDGHVIKISVRSIHI